MKVKYKTIDKEEIAKKGFMPYEYKAEKVEFCCEKMKEAYKKKFIVFGNPDLPLNSDNKINIVSKDACPEDTFYNIMPIDLCPWCKEKIETIEIKRTILSPITKITEKKEYIEVEEGGINKKQLKNCIKIEAKFKNGRVKTYEYVDIGKSDVPYITIYDQYGRVKSVTYPELIDELFEIKKDGTKEKIRILQSCMMS